MRSTKIAKVLSLILAVALVSALPMTSFAATVTIGDTGVTYDYAAGVMTVPVTVAAETDDQVTILASDTATYDEDTTKIMYLNQYDQSEITTNQIQFKINVAVADTIYIKTSATGMAAPATATYTVNKLPGLLEGAAAELAANVKSLTSAGAYTAAIAELQAIVDYGTANEAKVTELSSIGDGSYAKTYATVVGKLADYTSANTFRNALISGFGMDASTTLTAAETTGFVASGNLVSVEYESADAVNATVTISGVDGLNVSAVYGAENTAATLGEGIPVARPAEGGESADFTVTYTIASGDYTAKATVTKAITAVGVASDVIDETVDTVNVTASTVASPANFGGFDKYVEIKVGEGAIEVDTATQTIVALDADGEEIGELYYSAERGMFVGAFKSAEVGTTYKVVDKTGGAEAIIYGDVTGDNNVNVFDAIPVAQKAAGLYTGTMAAKQILAADVTGDKTIDVFDAIPISQKAAGLLSGSFAVIGK